MGRSIGSQAQTLRHQRYDQSVQGNPLRFGLGDKLCMQTRTGNSLNKATTYRGKRTGNLVAELLRYREPGLQGISTILYGFLRRGSIRATPGKIRKRNGIIPPPSSFERGRISNG